MSLKAFGVVLLLLAAFSWVLLWKTFHRPEFPAPRDYPALTMPGGTPTSLPEPPTERPRFVLDTLVVKEDTGGLRHALLTSRSRHGLYYQRGEDEPELLDLGVEVGASLDLAVDGGSRVCVAYCDARTGEVRFAVAGRKPRAWNGLQRIARPGLLTLTTDTDGALVSYYDGEAEVLHYSYWDARTESWRHGVANQGGGYRVVRGRPGAFVLSN